MGPTYTRSGIGMRLKNPGNGQVLDPADTVTPRSNAVFKKHKQPKTINAFFVLLLIVTLVR